MYLEDPVRQRIGRATAVLALVLAAVVSPAPAQAAPSTAAATAEVAAAAVVAECGFYIYGGFGPVRMCIRPVGSSSAQMYYHSKVTGKDTSITGPLRVVDPAVWARIVEAEDGTVAWFGGFALLNTAYGGVRWGAQFQESRRLARFGSYNVATRLFYPSSGWHPY
jgi:hypothetical protein